MALMLKLSSGTVLLALAEKPREMDAEDLAVREARERAKRAVLFVLEGGRTVALERGAGVECIGSKDSSSVVVSSITVGNSESSKAGSEGSEGISRPSTSLIRCQTLSGVSRRAAIGPRDRSE